MKYSKPFLCCLLLFYQIDPMEKPPFNNQPTQGNTRPLPGPKDLNRPSGSFSSFYFRAKNELGGDRAFAQWYCNTLNPEEKKTGLIAYFEGRKQIAEAEDCLLEDPHTSPAYLEKIYLMALTYFITAYENKYAHAFEDAEETLEKIHACKRKQLEAQPHSFEISAEFSEACQRLARMRLHKDKKL